MTMADTVAVMNNGVIEQMGEPVDLYEHPRTTFVANFLGQSNLVEGKVTEVDAGTLTVELHGAAVRVPAQRTAVETSPGAAVLLGVRPEKIHLANSSTPDPAGPNRLPGGRVMDVSFIGVSTQYLVQMPWGQRLMVFEQNTGVHDPVRAGDEVDLTWRPEHGFLLDAAQDAAAGVVEERTA